MKVLKQRPLERKYDDLKILKAKQLHSDVKRSCYLLVIFKIVLNVGSYFHWLFFFTYQGKEPSFQ